MDANKLETVLIKHQQWLNFLRTGERAHLEGADLEGAHLGEWYILSIGPIGSRQATLTYKRRGEFEEVMTGCWRGTLLEFQEAVTKKHGITKYGVAYQAAITFIRTLLAERKSG